MTDTNYAENEKKESIKPHMDLEEFLSYSDFSYDIVSGDSKFEQNLRKELIEDGKLDEKYLNEDLICFIDLQGAYLGDIDKERYPIEQTSVPKIVERLNTYINDYVIDEFETALCERDIDTDSMTLEEMADKCRELGVGDGEVCYVLADVITHPDLITLNIPEREQRAPLDAQINYANKRALEQDAQKIHFEHGVNDR